MHKKRRVHDSIVGAVITLGVALAYWVSPLWLVLPGVIGVLMIQSGFSGFCPVYYTLDKLGMADHEPAAQQG